ncbi:coproporphyrinogen oxidase [Malassezia japonica]|uniref:Coproporphyrinogen oxidase n=1 Tax=Malassezia japonica TaxID=223818 RepID=A0AAF0F0C9_9BASI|nr:coproporphyrinogen oxidase [Malassezia japonica]WFD40420.1 coproporphyrinogen oxidase [Malassezia japonica]
MTTALAQRALPFAKPAVLLICDMQEKFRPAIYHFDHVLSTADKLVKAAQILEIPTLATEQYPKGLGPTVPELASEIRGVKEHAIRDKSTFSMAANGLVLDMLKSASGKSLQYTDVEFILCGIESHVCVLQTALDLTHAGARVHVVRDGISSCNRNEVPIAVDTMRAAGATVSTSESLLFQLLAISGLIRDTKVRTAHAVETLCS